jgi:hypothetical protein
MSFSYVGTDHSIMRGIVAQTVPSQTKKADVAEYPEVFDHVGSLVNEPPSQAGMLFVQSSDNAYSGTDLDFTGSPPLL